MANTYSQIYIHFVFAVYGRANLIKTAWRNELYKYITGIVSKKRHKLIAIGGVDDHIHILIGFEPDDRISKLVQEIKANSSRFVNRRRLAKGKFKWQSGYGAFSYSRSQIPAVARYIENQAAHHAKTSFRREYLGFLKRFEVDFEEEYLFDWNE